MRSRMTTEELSDEAKAALERLQKAYGLDEK